MKTDKQIIPTSNIKYRDIAISENKVSLSYLEKLDIGKYIDPLTLDCVTPPEDNWSILVTLFTIGEWMTEQELDEKYKALNLVAIDAYTLAILNETDPRLCEKYPNGTHWKDQDGNWCFGKCTSVAGKQSLRIGYGGIGWCKNLWFAGFSKKTQLV